MDMPMNRTNVVSIAEWKRARALDRARGSTTVRAVDAGTRLRTEDWGKIQAQVTAFAYRRTRRRSWEHAEDLAQAAITQLLSRPSAWEPAKEPLLKHLCKRVISLASNEWHHKRSSFEVAMEKSELEDLEVADDGEAIEEVIDRRRLAAQFRARLEQRFAGDETALAVIVLMMEGLDSPAALAKASGLPLPQIVEARRRIFYNAETIAAELGHEIDAGDGDEEEEVVR
jgi:hypothetical protein